MPHRDVVGTEKLTDRREEIAERLADIEKEGDRLRLEDTILSDLLKKSERIEFSENGQKSYNFGPTEAITEYVRDHPHVSRSKLLDSLERQVVSDSENRRQVLSSTLSAMISNVVIIELPNGLSLMDDT